MLSMIIMLLALMVILCIIYIRQKLRLLFMIDISASMYQFYHTKNAVQVCVNFFLSIAFLLSKNPIRVIFYSNDILQDNYIKNKKEFNNIYKFAVKRKNSFTCSIYERELNLIENKFKNDKYFVITLDDISKKFLSKVFFFLIDMRTKY